MSKMRACIVTGWPVDEAILDFPKIQNDFYDAVVIQDEDCVYFGSIVWDDTYILEIPAHLYEREKQSAEYLWYDAFGEENVKKPKMYLLCVDEEEQLGY